MPENTPTPSRRHMLDGDKLGFVGGGVVALGVALVQMFYRDADPAITIIRSGWTFVAAYAAVFILVRTTLRTALFEMVDEKGMRRGARRRQLHEARADDGVELGAGGITQTLGESTAARP